MEQFHRQIIDLFEFDPPEIPPLGPLRIATQPLTCLICKSLIEEDAEYIDLEGLPICLSPYCAQDVGNLF